MPTAKNLNDLKSLITSKTKKLILESIGESVVSELKDEYDKEVYSYNESSMTERTYGLMDDENYNIDINETYVEVYSTLKPNPSILNIKLTNPNVTLAEWIEHGNIPNIFNDKDYEWMHPRPVIETVKNNINNNTGDFKKIIKKELSKNGINTKNKL